MYKNLFLLFFFPFMLFSCTTKEVNNNDNMSISATTITEAIKQAGENLDQNSLILLEKGVKHTASLWRTTDGSAEDFINFCKQNFVADSKEKEILFDRYSIYFESLFGHFNKLSLDMQENVHLQKGNLLSIDPKFAAFNPGAHLINDLYDNKIAFNVSLNFPYFPTEEKNELAASWDDTQWGYARLGDVFSSRIPSEIVQHEAKVNAQSDAYIADYNIYMGSLLSKENKKLFPENLILLSHWNLRDEIKANYSNKETGFEKQEIIYLVMQRIVDQSIPKLVINSGKQEWNPFANEITESGVKTDFQPENDARYQHILNTFNLYKEVDKYNPAMNTAILRAFSGGMQVPQAEVENLFVEFLSSPQIKDVAAIIKKRLNRDLSPWDIWYDGFKARSSINEELLNKITETKYPDAISFEKDLKNMLVKLGFNNEKSEFLASRITVDPARGSGHAWGAAMKAEKAHLRTRIPASGMNYKGYNIAIHEFGHNVEQTISLHDVPNYMMNGVPNTAFTEALAFTFQERDLFLLEMKDNNPDKEYLKTLDIFWSLYEIMGVSVVDMKMWKWLYKNPNCTAVELRDAVLEITKDVWNKYYAPVFGQKDQTILGIYSHMISSPMYLPNYAFGHLIHFQLEEHFKTNDFDEEVLRIFALGQLTPNEWMKKAVGKPLSNDAIFKATEEAVTKIKL